MQSIQIINQMCEEPSLISPEFNYNQNWINFRPDHTSEEYNKDKDL